jgi:hypothetical protein
LRVSIARMTGLSSLRAAWSDAAVYGCLDVSAFATL